MGNQALQKINPCSQQQLKPYRPSIIQSNSKLNHSSNAHKIKTINNQPLNSDTIKPPILQPMPLQPEQSLSTEGTSSKTEEPRVQVLDLNGQQQRQQQQKNADNIFPSQDKKVFIFDWDDTLFFSSQLRKQRFYNRHLELRSPLIQKFDQSVCLILNSCLAIGEVCIVTNSQEGWVKLSSQMFLPKTLEAIFKKGEIKVISSRPKMEQYQLHKTEDKKWKYKSFRAILAQLVVTKQNQSFVTSDLHVICVGDSQEEIDASNEIHAEFHHQFRNFFIKTVKLQDFPNMEDLLEQQQLFLKQLEKITKTHRKLTIKLERPKSQKSNT